MAMTVSDLQSALAGTAALEHQLREWLQLIDNKIRDADRVFGRNVITVDLPVSFGIPGLDKKEQQRYIYCNILLSLRKRGFEVRILLNDDTTRLYIAFTISFTPEQLETMSAVIRDSLIRPAQVAAFFEPSPDNGASNSGAPAKKAGAKVMPESGV